MPTSEPTTPTKDEVASTTRTGRGKRGSSSRKRKKGEKEKKERRGGVLNSFFGMDDVVSTSEKKISKVHASPSVSSASVYSPNKKNPEGSSGDVPAETTLATSADLPSIPVFHSKKPAAGETLNQPDSSPESSEDDQPADGDNNGGGEDKEGDIGIIQPSPTTTRVPQFRFKSTEQVNDYLTSVEFPFQDSYHNVSYPDKASLQ